jgi:hypothetical protein
MEITAAAAKVGVAIISPALMRVRSAIATLHAVIM